jgi:hypothetical protein
VNCPLLARPQVLEGKVTFKCTVAQAAAAGTSTTLIVYLIDDLGNVLEAALMATDAAPTSAYYTLPLSYDIEANAAARTYHLEVAKIGSTSGTFVAMNGAILAAHRSRLRARAA